VGCKGSESVENIHQRQILALLTHCVNYLGL